ncbi:M1 family metallopeptidase [Streptomyces sp. NPDC004647]|uniref:M1 family metallopeptidase n=1 Tax=Streptomyces sp. NPDC004647 TaxID=3154671 RepID=UPI0033AD76FA
MKPTVRTTLPTLALAALLTGTGGATAPDPGPAGEARGRTAAEAPRTEAGPARIDYDVGLRSDGRGARWSGREAVTFTNTAGTPLHEVYLRLWGNAGDGCGSREEPPPVEVGRIEGGEPGGLSVGCTALRIDLAEPLPHGGRTTLAFDVTIAVPDQAERFGRHGPYSFLGNAVPVLAVRDRDQGWHLDPDVGFGESYYTLAADFRVRLNHPSALKVPATGTPSDRPGDRGRTVTTSTALQARDFAWAAGPFRTATEFSSRGVRVNSFWTAGTPASDAEEARRDARAAMDDFGERFGRYPDGEVDLVLHEGFDTTSGNMEYPGFVLLRSEEKAEATVHELAHQWWYGIVGNDQFGAPWLDEAFAVYADDLFRGHERRDCRSGSEQQREEAWITRTMGNWARSGGSWKAAAYVGGACALHDLEREIGRPAMAELLRQYARDHWHGVSTTADFRAAAQDAAGAGKDLGSFWRKHGIR